MQTTVRLRSLCRIGQCLPWNATRNYNEPRRSMWWQSHTISSAMTQKLHRSQKRTSQQPHLYQMSQGGIIGRPKKRNSSSSYNCSNIMSPCLPKRRNSRQWAESLDLDLLLCQHDWDLVKQVLQSAPERASEGFTLCKCAVIDKNAVHTPVPTSSVSISKLHFLCGLPKKPSAAATPAALVPLSLLHLLASLNPRAIAMPDCHMRTPLHLLAQGPESAARLAAVLQYREAHVRRQDVLLTDARGATPLHLACASEEATLETLQVLVSTNPESLFVKCNDGSFPIECLYDLATPLMCPVLDSSIFTIASGSLETTDEETSTAGEEEDDSDGAVGFADLSRFWAKLRFMAESMMKYQSPSLASTRFDMSLHGILRFCPRPEAIQLALLMSPSSVQTLDMDGNLPVHVLLMQHAQKKNLNPRQQRQHQSQVESILAAFPAAATVANRAGLFPLHITLNAQLPSTVVARAAPSILAVPHPKTGRYAVQYMVEHNSDDTKSIDAIFAALRPVPNVLESLRYHY